MNLQTYDNLKNKLSFDRNELFSTINNSGQKITESSFKAYLTDLLKSGIVIRNGRNAYQFNLDKKKEYSPQYSEYANEIADYIKSNTTDISFVIFETLSLNEFLNHLISRNTIFLYIENGCEESLFELLNEKYPGKVLFKPNCQTFNQYWNENKIIIQKLISESPKNSINKWCIRIEKLLVDIFTDKNIQLCFEESELSSIFEQAFQKFCIDESSLFRYARRRKAEDKILNFISTNTSIKLRTR